MHLPQLSFVLLKEVGYEKTKDKKGDAAGSHEVHWASQLCILEFSQ
jgi:hypothetical protein